MTKRDVTHAAVRVPPLEVPAPVADDAGGGVDHAALEPQRLVHRGSVNDPEGAKLIVTTTARQLRLVAPDR